MKLILRHIFKYKKLLFFNFLSVFSFLLVELGIPALLAKVIDEGINVKNTATVSKYGIWMVVVMLLGFVGQVLLAYFASRISSNTVRDIREEVFQKTRSFSVKEFDDFGVSSMITRTNNDAFQLMLFSQMLLRTGFIAPMMFLGSLFLLLKESLSLSFVLGIAFAILIAAVTWMAVTTERLSKVQQKNLDGINQNMRESLTGIRVIRAFIREKFEQERFKKVNDAYTKISKKIFYIMSTANPAFGFLLYAVVLAIVWIGSNFVVKGTMQVGQLTAFIDYVFHVLFSLMMFTVLFVSYPRAAVSAARIIEVLETEPSIVDNENGETKTVTEGYITFDDVSFAFSDNSESPVLRDISFTAEPGQTVAFIGSTGSGKSTLIQLIPRFFDVTKGNVVIDGVDVRDYKLEALRKKIGFIPQKAVLFSGTIADNLRFGNEHATLEELQRAADVAQATEFINSKDEGFDYVLAEGGTNLSGGQKQRLSIARALVAKPSIYVFDDSFSALDYKTDATLRAALKGYTENATVLIVAQRVGTIMDADKIIVLNEGEVVAIGTHKELLKTSDIYYDIAASQLSKEELE